MRVRYCRTISREVMRPCSIAVCISRMLDSTTVNACLLAGGGRWAARGRATVVKTKECVIVILPLDKMEGKPTTLLVRRLSNCGLRNSDCGFWEMRTPSVDRGLQNSDCSLRSVERLESIEAAPGDTIQLRIAEFGLRILGNADDHVSTNIPSLRGG